MHLGIFSHAMLWTSELNLDEFTQIILLNTEMFWITSVYLFKVKLLICATQAPIEYVHDSICNTKNNNSKFKMIWHLYYPWKLQRCCLVQKDGKEREREKDREGRRRTELWMIYYTFVVWLKRPWFICTTHNIITPCTVCVCDSVRVCV